MKPQILKPSSKKEKTDNEKILTKYERKKLLDKYLFLTFDSSTNFIIVLVVKN